MQLHLVELRSLSPLRFSAHSLVRFIAHFMNGDAFCPLFSSPIAVNMWHNQVASLIAEAKKKSMKPETPQKKCGRRRASIFDVSAPRPANLTETSLLLQERYLKMADRQRHSRFEYGPERHRISNRFNCPLPQFCESANSSISGSGDAHKVVQGSTKRRSLCCVILAS